MKEKSMYKKYIDNEISRKEYQDWWAQQKGFKDYSEYIKKYRQLHKEHIIEKAKQYNQNNVELIAKLQKR